jgi:hypothetical protein
LHAVAILVDGKIGCENIEAREARASGTRGRGEANGCR